MLDKERIYTNEEGFSVKLTQREEEILKQLFGRLDDREMAIRLNTSFRSLMYSIGKLYSKFGIKDLPRRRLELAIIAIKLEFLSENTNLSLFILTPCQQEILKFAAKGDSNKEIARKLGRSPQTVKNHFSYRLEIDGSSGIFERLEVGNRTEAVMKALKLGILNLEEI